MKKLLFCATVVAAMGLGATPALAVHEANNQFDLAATSAAPGADGSGYSNFVGGNNGWNNYVTVEGLSPDTSYTWYGIAGSPPSASVICSFVTDSEGDGECRSDVNSRLGRTEVRQTQAQTVVLQATDFQDDDNKVSDGEIERRGTCRFEGNARCDANGR
ncbi:MAG: hypothetical protein M3134_11980 [Actinomycetota bacterium]|nr:hypothetical protein [Actinomycetota bacterium]